MLNNIKTNKAQGLHNADLACSIECNLNSEYGPSPFQAVHDALRTHRDHCLKQAFSEIRNGDYENAHISYNDYEALNYVLDNLTLSLAKQVSNNYFAEDEALSPGSYQKMREGVPARMKEDYDLFLKMVLGESAVDEM